MSERAAEHNYRMALMFYRTERYDDAIAILDDLALEYPDSKHVVYALTKCFMKVGRYSDARELCRELLERHNDERAETLLLRLGDREDTYVPRCGPREAPPELPVGGESASPPPVSGLSSPPDDTTSSWMSSTPTGLLADSNASHHSSPGNHFISSPSERTPSFATPSQVSPRQSEQPLIVPPPLVMEHADEDAGARKASSGSRNMVIATLVIVAAIVVLWLLFSPHHFDFPEDQSLGMLQIRENRGRHVRWTEYGEARGQVTVPKWTYIGLLASEDLGEADLMLLRDASWLKSLDLSGTQITDDMIDLLVQLRQLEVIDVRGTALTESGIVRLREWLPGCIVRFEVKAQS